ncbi:MAG: hypothetical protein ACP5UA_07965 [Candidatus Hydrogenedens sp.]
MMEVLIDGVKGFQFSNSPDTLQSALNEIMNFLNSQQLAMVKLRVNEQEVYPGRSLESIQEMNISNIRTLEINTYPIYQLVEEGIADLELYSPELSDLCCEIARVFQSENPDEGFDPFQKLSEIWSEIKKREALIINILSSHVTEENPIIRKIKEHHDELNHVLEEAYKSLENNDCIGLGDLLEYELAPLAEKEPEIVGQLKQLAIQYIIKTT